jgi:adenylate cyclase
MAESAPTNRKSRVFSWYNLIAPLVVVVLIYLLSSEFLFQETFERVENLTLDSRIRYRAENQPPPDPRILLVAIEENSTKIIGRFPWPRAVYGDFIALTQPAAPKVYCFDIFVPDYTEIQTVDGKSTPVASESDLRLVDVTRSVEIPSIWGAQLIVFGKEQVDADRSHGKTVSDQRRLGWDAGIELSNSSLSSGERFEMSYPELLEVSLSGLVNAEPHADGVVRAVPLVAVARGEDGNQLVPSLALRALIEFWEIDPEAHLKIVPGDAVYIDSPIVKRRIPINKKGEYHVNWRHQFQHYIDNNLAAAFVKIVFDQQDRLLNNKEPENPVDLEGKILFVGQTGTGMVDMAQDPWAPRSPLPMVHLNIMDNILKEDYLVQVPRWVTWLVVLLLSYLTILTTAKLGFWLKTAIPLVILIIYVPLTYLIFDLGNLHLELVFPCLSFLILNVGSIARQVLEERQAKEEMRRTFSAYVAPGIIDSIYDDPDKLQLGGAKKDVSILFTDIRSFTTMTENMDSEILVAQLNEYFEQMVDAIMSHQGTLHKFIGDAIMAVWGDIKYAGPTLDAGQALSAALAMRHRLSQLNRQWTGESRPEFRMGMGINYGQVVVGNIGAPQRMEFTVIGDAVNLAARLESLNKQFGTEILVGESIYDLAHERFNFRFAGKVQVKGKGTGVSIYEVLCEKGSENESPYDLKWVQLYEEAFTRFNERRYDVATRLFEACLNDYPDDTLSSMWLDYSRYFIETPPPEDWDGTIEMTSK